METQSEGGKSDFSVPCTPKSTQTIVSSVEKTSQTEIEEFQDEAIIYKVLKSNKSSEPVPSTSSEVKTPSAFSYGSLECSSIELVDESIQKSSNQQQTVESQNQNEQKSEKVRIIDVQVIKPADDESQKDDENGNNMMEVEESCDRVDEPKLQNEKKSATNRILISDSEDDDDAQNNNNSNQQSANNNDSNNNNSNNSQQYSSAYAYTNLNGDRFESATRTETNGGRRRHFHRTRNCRSNPRRFEDSNFREQMRNFNRMNAENFERVQENLRITGEQVGRTFSATAQMFPDLVSNFRSHFVRPLFTAGVHQHFFDPSGHQ